MILFFFGISAFAVDGLGLSQHGSAAVKGNNNDCAMTVMDFGGWEYSAAYQPRAQLDTW